MIRGILLAVMLVSLQVGLQANNSNTATDGDCGQKSACCQKTTSVKKQKAKKTKEAKVEARSFMQRTWHFDPMKFYGNA
jgi:hypothetical protein